MAPSSTPRNFTREARRSAPARLSNSYAMPLAGNAQDSRQRHAVRKHTHKRGMDAAIVPDGRTVRRRRMRSGSTSSASSSDEGDMIASKDFSRVGTDDMVLEDGDSDSSYNSFNLGLQKKMLLEDDDEGLGLPEEGDDRRLTSSTSFKGDEKDRLTTVYRVYRSRYVGDLFRGGDLSAELLTGTNRRVQQRELSRPLYRWMHVENPGMVFGTFVQVVLECPWLDAGQRENVGSILRVARQNSEKSLRMPPGKQGSYVEPEFYEETVQQTVFQGFRSRRQKVETVKWMCIPYFVTSDQPVGKVKRRFTASEPVEYPFLNSGYVLEGNYFQVAQLWCLMVGDSLMITCARRAIEDMPGQFINIKTLPPADPHRRNSGDRAPVIIVSDGGIRTWLIPADTCVTWPEFASNFAELGVDLFEGWDVVYQGARITRQDWPKIMALAAKVSIRLTLQKNDDDDSSYDDSDSDADLPEIQTSDETGNADDPAMRPLTPIPTDEEKSSTKDNWYVFTLMATRADAPSPPISDTTPAAPPKLVVDQGRLRADSDEIDAYLTTTNRRRGEAAAWHTCPQKTYTEVKNYIASLPPDDGTGLNSQRQALFRAARAIFTLFYPLAYAHPVAGKYWGALDRLLRSPPSATTLAATARRVRSLAHAASDVKHEIFGRHGASPPALYNQTNVPHEFIQAWLLVLMFAVLAVTGEAGRTADYARRAKALLAAGKMKIVRRLQTVSLREREAATTTGAAAVLVAQLVQDARGAPMFADRHRLATLYWRDIQAVTAEVHATPLSRRHQETFLSLKGELDTIAGILEDEQRVLVALDDSVRASEAKSVIGEGAAGTKTPARETAVIELSLQSADVTLANFVEMARRVGELEAWHFRMVESNKDRQEKAALAFTTVSVLFLPLTMLASLFGMNTKDIRNLNEGQWVFWVTAGPMSVIGIMIWLVYLGSFKGWMRGAYRWRQRRQRRQIGQMG
ncbi:hypothetical protein EJ06DRAFT_530070 [Trichodelitschia bisporula]|uniref:Cora-domain-containing protein n=1 Tax=Trichodelitschia bisporula TaxID=703511 RepID=A0A6G1HYP7_9PEZI|nr:hypothetical protein EJ06DRAFT_530070 [Trichodelitschia bisporula]